MRDFAGRSKKTRRTLCVRSELFLSPVVVAPTLNRKFGAEAIAAKHARYLSLFDHSSNTIYQICFKCYTLNIYVVLCA